MVDMFDGSALDGDPQTTDRISAHWRSYDRWGMLTFTEVQERTEQFLTVQILEALQELRDRTARSRTRRCSSLASPDPSCAWRPRCHLPHQQLWRRAIDAAAAKCPSAGGRLSRTGA